MSKNGVIGKKNDLPWNLPTDLKNFKKVTSGKTIIMGRNTWDSLPYRPLPNRINVVITRNTEFKAEGCEIRNNLIEAIKEFDKVGEELFIIGGAEIYKQSFNLADKLYLTNILNEVDGDIFVDGLINENWVLLKFDGPYNEDNLDYRFEEYASKERFNDYLKLKNE
jgi:dihydrofolate reductase